MYPIFTVCCDGYEDHDDHDDHADNDDHDFYDDHDQDNHDDHDVIRVVGGAVLFFSDHGLITFSCLVL